MKKNKEHGNQRTRVLNWLKEHKTIDPLTSWRKLGIYRLSAVICDLRKEGYYIITEDKVVQNKYNEDCTVAQYIYKGKLCKCTLWKRIKGTNKCRFCNKVIKQFEEMK